VPLLTVVREIRNGLMWVRAVVLPAPARILEVDPAQFLIVGHRGAGASAVENTIESYERAVEVEGANAVEIDLCVTQDGQVVVWHDWDPDALVAFARQAEAELYSMCRPVVPPAGHAMRRPVCDLTLDELREHYGYAIVGTTHLVPARIPVLEDVVRWARTKPQLKAVLLDCKVPPARKELITVVATALRREVEQEPVGAQFVFLTPYTEVFEVMQAVVPAAVRSFDVEIPAGFVPDRSQLSAVAWRARRGTAGPPSAGPSSLSVVGGLIARRSGLTSSRSERRTGQRSLWCRNTMSAGPSTGPARCATSRAWGSRGS
jgi:hypothetical protein